MSDCTCKGITVSHMQCFTVQAAYISGDAEPSLDDSMAYMHALHVRTLS